MARPRGTPRPLESAESYVRGDVRAGPTHDEPTRQRYERATAEVKRLRNWAFDRYGDDVRTLKLPSPFLGSGAEHEVYGDARRGRVVKVTHKSGAASFGFGISLNNDGEGATTGEYLDRLLLHNDIFNDDVRLEQVVPQLGLTRVVISQPFIKGEEPEPPQIDAYMAAKGFERLAVGTYYDASSGVLVHDLHPRNAVLTPQGEVRAVDPAILRATPELAEFIRRRAEAEG